MNKTPFTTGSAPIVRSQAFYRAPGHDIAAPLLALVEGAKSTLDIEIYGFAWEPLTEALLDAHDRGVRVRILFDHTQACGPSERGQVARLAAAGIEHWIGSSPCRAIRHSKFLIVDEEWVEMGSLNYSASAFKQNNTVLILRDKEIAADLLADWIENRDWIAANEPNYQTQNLQVGVTPACTEGSDGS